MKRLALYTIGIFLALLLPVTAFAQTGAPQRHPGKKFQRLDLNHDGRISRDEWTRKPKAFDRLDLNHDGFITREELRQHRPRRR